MGCVTCGGVIRCGPGPTGYGPSSPDTPAALGEDPTNRRCELRAKSCCFGCSSLRALVIGPVASGCVGAGGASSGVPGPPAFATRSSNTAYMLLIEAVWAGVKVPATPPARPTAPALTTLLATSGSWFGAPGTAFGLPSSPDMNCTAFS